MAKKATSKAGASKAAPKLKAAPAAAAASKVKSAAKAKGAPKASAAAETKTKAKAPAKAPTAKAPAAAETKTKAKGAAKAPAAAAKTKVAPKKVDAIKLTDAQRNVLKEVAAANQTGGVTASKKIQKQIESLQTKKLIKRGKKDGEFFKYLLTKLGEKHYAELSAAPSPA